MRKLKGILTLILLLALVVSPVAVFASNISGAKYYATIIISNNSTATNFVSVNCTINTQALIDGGYLNSSANNCVIRSSAGADLPFMPAANTSYPWCIWVPSIGENSHISDILYTANSTGGEIRYFPAAGGMSTTDNETMELGGNFTIEQSGWIDTTYSVNRSLVYKSGAFRTYISATGNITSVITEGEDFGTYTEVDVPNKIIVTPSRVTAADVDRDESIYLYKDMGASYFDALDIDFEIYIDSNGLADGLGAIACANVTGDMSAFGTTEIGVYFGEATPNYITLFRGKITDSDSWLAPAVDTPYYCTLTRAAGGDSANCTIYSDSTRETLLDTLTVAGYGTIKWRYIYGFISYDTGAAGKDFDGYVQNLSFGEVEVTIATVPSGENTITTTADDTFFYVESEDITWEGYAPARADLKLNAPLWHREFNTSPFTTKDATEHSCTVNNAVWSSDGYVFDGTNDNIILPANLLTSSIHDTFSMWVKYDLADSHYIFSMDLNETSVYQLGGGDLHLFYDGVARAADAPDWATNTWVNLTFTLLRNGTAYIYTNGTELISGAMPNTAVSTTAARLGEDTGGGSDFTGTIGEFTVWDRILDSNEVLAHYNATKWKYNGSGEYFYYQVSENVTDTTTDWSYYQNMDDYWEYTEVSVNGTQVQGIVWEYGTTFQDSSGFDNDATPTFRTTSSDPDVSAVLTSFLPVTEAKAPAYALEDAPPFIETVPTIVSGWAVEPPAGAFPLAGVIATIALATKTPPQLPLLILAAFVILACSLTVSGTMRRYGSRSLIVKIITITAVMGVFIALQNFGIDFWMLFVFLVIAIALAMASRHAVWQ